MNRGHNVKTLIQKNLLVQIIRLGAMLALTNSQILE